MQYEQLRSQVTSTARDVARGDIADQPRGVGLALLLSEGMPSWLKAVEAALHSASAIPRAVAGQDGSSQEDFKEYSSVPVWLAGVQRHEVTALWASLILSTRPVTHQFTKEEHRSW